MKRPFAFLGFTFFIMLLAAISFGFNLSVIISLLLAILFLLSISFKKFRNTIILPIVLFTAFIATVSFCLSYKLKVPPVKSLDNKDVLVSGKICEPPTKSYGRYFYVIETDSIQAESAIQHTKIKVSTSQALEAEIFDNVTAKVHLYIPKNKETGLDTKNFYYSKGIFLLGFIYEYEYIQIEKQDIKPFQYYIYRAKEFTIDSLKTMLPPKQASIICGVLLGDKQDIPEDVTNNFRSIGVSHIFSVSGLHVSIVSQLLLYLFTLIKIPKKLAAIFASIGVSAFVILVGIPISAFRAGIMIIITLCGTLFEKTSDPLNSLGIAALVICISNPFAAGDIGFILSFFATLGLISLLPKIQSFLKSKIKKVHCSINTLNTFINKLIPSLIDIISVTISATIFTLPFVIITFKEVSLISPISNILLVLPATIMMLSSLIATTFYLIGFLQFLSIPFAFVAGLLSNYTQTCSYMLANIKFASLSVSQPFATLWLAFSILLISFLVYFKLELNKKFIRLTAISSVLIFLFGITSLFLFETESTTISVLDSGNSCNIIIKKFNRSAVISCGSTSSTATKINSFIKDNHIDYIDYMLIPKIDKATSSIVDNIINRYNPNVIYINQEHPLNDRFSRSIQNKNNIFFFKNISNCILWNDININVYSTLKESFVTLKIQNSYILICPSGGDINNIPINKRSFDFIITSELPLNIQNIKSKYTLLSMNEDRALNSIKSISNMSEYAMLTSEQGNINLTYNQNGSISIR